MTVRVCFWATAFQADVQAFAHHLAERPGFEVLVATDDPDAYAREPVSRIMPFRGRLTDRGRVGKKEIESFAPHLVVIDNHLPKRRVAERMLVLWHGFGWRVDDLSVMRREIRAHVGAPEEPNDRFRWQAFGEWDRDYRIHHSGFAPENVVALGSAYSDLLRPESELRRSFDPARVADAYGIDVTKKTVMMGLTWHHGGALAHWGDEEALLGRVADHLATGGANLLLRMHNRTRYEKKYVAMLEALAARRPNVELKFKSESPDSLVDLLVSDVLVSNYSSLLDAFYYTEKPTVHIDPIDAEAGTHYYRKMRFGRVTKVRVDDPRATWKLPPEEIGGLRVSSFDALLSALDRALAEPGCCAALARDFVRRYITGVDGGTRARIERFVAEWLGDE